MDFTSPEFKMAPTPPPRGGGGGDSYERGGDARRKFCIKPLKETSLFLSLFFLPLKETILKHKQIKNTVTFRVQP